MEKVRKDGSPVTPAWVGALSHGVVGGTLGMGAGGLSYLLGKRYVKNRLGPSFVPAFERKYAKGFLPVGKGAAAGAALGLGYWGGKQLYNKWKNGNKTTESAFASALLKEVLDRSDKPRDLSNPYDRAQLGLDIAKTFGADKVISERLQKPEHRANAWRGALKGAAIGLGGLGAVAVGGVLGERLLHGARAFRYSRGLGKKLSSSWKFAKDEVRSRFHPLLPSLGEELIAASKYAPKVAAAGGGIGGLYGLMKNSKTTKKGVPKSNTTESAFVEAYNPATGNVVGALGRKVKELAVTGERIRPQRKILMIGGIPHHFLNGKLVQRGARMLQATDRAFMNLLEGFIAYRKVASSPLKTWHKEEANAGAWKNLFGTQPTEQEQNKLEYKHHRNNHYERV